MTPQPRLGYALSGTAAVLWALTGPGISYLLTHYHIPALTIAFWRDAVMALACVLALLIFRPALLRVGRRDLGVFALVGALSVGLYHALCTFSITLNGAAVAIVILYTFPTFVTLGARLFFGERLRWPQLAGLALALLGCALVMRAYDPALLRLNWQGAAVGLLAALMHSGYVLYNQRAVQRHSPWTALTYAMLFGALALLALLLVAAPPQLGAIGAQPMPWLVLVALALGPTLGGYAIFTAALRHIPGQVASLIAVLEAPISTLIAVLLLGEHLAWPQFVGMLLILGAIGLPRLLEGRRMTSDQRSTTSDEQAVSVG